MSDLPKTVFIVDDDPSFLAAMSRWLCAFGYSIESYSSVMDFLTQRPKQAAGCVITDLSMPGMGGIDLQSALAQSGNPLPIVFLTGHGDIPASVEAMRNGAEDFLLKTAEKEAILDAVERALARDIFERSVKRHRANLMKKLQVSSVAELARIAVEAGLVSETGEPGNVGDDAFPAT